MTSALQAEPDWSSHAGNLLQGAFASRARLELPGTLRVAAMFLLAAFALQVLSEWAHYGYYRYQAGKTAAEAVTRYRALYPGENIAGKPAAAWQQVQQRMRGKRNEGNAGAADVLPSLTRVAQSLQGSGLSTQRVDIQSGVLTLDMNARSLGELDGFKQQLEGQGFSTEILSANNQGGVIRGRLRVEGGA
jgi:type II secretory pathway component PulL